MKPAHAMQRTLAFCILSALSGALIAAPPPASTNTTATETDAAIQQQMAALQARMNALASRMAALSTRLGDQANASVLHYLADGRRGMFGMAVIGSDTGMRVNAVTPGGPAERAGIKVGDVITAINGKPLSFDAASWLVDTSGLPPGKPARLDLLRGGKSRRIDVTPERLQSGDWQEVARAAQQAAEEATASVRSPEFQRQIQQSVDEAMKSAAAALKDAGVARETAKAAREGAAAARAGALEARDAAIRAGHDRHAWIISMSPWWGLNLAPLNADLGRYFGTNAGVLVLSRNDQQFPELQPGDVLTEVNGKAVTQPEDVQRALRSVDADQRVPVSVRRHGKQLTLAMKVPPRWNVMPPPPPLPPVPPVPPQPALPIARPPPAPLTPPAPPAPPPRSATPIVPPV